METVRRVQTWVDEIGAWIDEVRDTNIKELIWDNLIKISDTISRIAFVKKDEGLTIEIPFENTTQVDFEAIGLAGEYDPNTKKIEPLKLFIGSTGEVRKWLNKFGGLDIVEYVRYDKYAELLNELREREKVIEELREQLAEKIEEIKKLYMKIKELNEKIDELELELAGKDRPVC